MPLLPRCVKCFASIFQLPFNDDPSQNKFMEREYLAFKRDLQSQIQIRGAYVCLVVFLIGLYALFTSLQQETNQPVVSSLRSCDDDGEPSGPLVQPYAWASEDPRSAHFYALLAFCCVSGTFSIFSGTFSIPSLLGSWRCCKRLKRREKCEKCCNRLKQVVPWEKVFCLFACFLIFLMPMCASKTSANLFVTDDFAEFDEARCHWQSYTGTSPSFELLRCTLIMDALLTSICFSVPLRAGFSLCICCCAVTTWVVFALRVENRSNESWISELLLFLCLVLFACRGALDQHRLRWQTWISRSKVQEEAATGKAVQTIAECLCDYVVCLTSDLRVCGNVDDLTSFFGSAVGGCPFKEFLSSYDVQRFESVVAGISATQSPACLTVSMRSTAVSHASEARLCVSKVVDAQYDYVLGISLERASLPRGLVDAPMVPGASRGGLGSDRLHENNTSGNIMEDFRHKLQWSDVGRLASAQASVQPSPSVFSVNLSPASLADTEIAFATLDFQQIKHLGIKEHWLLDQSTVNINFDDVMGKGGFGIVYGGTLCGTHVAVKCQESGPLGDSSAWVRRLASLAQEIRFFRHIRHPNIVLFHGAVVSNDKICLVLERMYGSTLSAFVHDHSQMKKTWQKSLILDTTRALWYLHTMTPYVVHGDLKPQNVMVELRSSKKMDESHVVTPYARLIDFGLSLLLHSRHPKPQGGTRTWTAPEVYKREHVPLPSSDIFSLGCILFFIANGTRPFEVSMSSVRTAEEIPPLPWIETSLLYVEARQLCERCVAFDQAARPHAQEVHAHVQAWVVAEDSDERRELSDRGLRQVTGHALLAQI